MQINAQIEKYQKSLDEFMKNASWEKLYKNAPDGAKGWLEAEFDASLSEEEPPEGEDADYNLYTGKMKKEDWKWLIEYDCHHPAQKKFFEEQYKKATE